MREPFAQFFHLIFLCLLARVRAMEVFPASPYFKHHTGALTFPHLSADGYHQSFDVGKEYSSSGGNRKNRLQGPLVFCLHMNNDSTICYQLQIHTMKRPQSGRMDPVQFLCIQPGEEMIVYSSVKLPQVNTQQLVSFYFVAKEESFSAASEKLFVSQPAVTQQIKALEAQFGVKLFNVKRKRVHLTPAGQRLVSYAEEIINHILTAENFLKGYRLNNLHIGVSTTLMGYLTPVLDKFKELYSSVRISVKDGPSLTLVNDLLEFRCDVCLVGTLQEVNKKLQVRRGPEVEKMVLVANPDYPLVGKGEVKWEDFVDHPLILQSEGSMAREAMLAHFAARNLNPLIGAEVDNIECCKELARQKKGVAFMFLPNVVEEVARRQLAIIPVTDGEIKLGIDIVWNEEMGASPILNGFLEVVERHFNHLINFPI